MVLSKVTKNGQITIPKQLRDEMDIQEGDYVEIICTGEEILLRPKKMKIYDPKTGEYSSL